MEMQIPALLCRCAKSNWIKPSQHMCMERAPAVFRPNGHRLKWHHLSYFIHLRPWATKTFIQHLSQLYRVQCLKSAEFPINYCLLRCCFASCGCVSSILQASIPVFYCGQISQRNTNRHQHVKLLTCLSRWVLHFLYCPRIFSHLGARSWGIAAVGLLESLSYAVGVNELNKSTWNDFTAVWNQKPAERTFKPFIKASRIFIEISTLPVFS